jgi:rod shape determining protein RodA
MSINKTNIVNRLSKFFVGFDMYLALIILSLFTIGSLTVYSARIGTVVEMSMHIRNVLLSILLIWFIAQIPPSVIMKFAVPIYTIGIALLCAVIAFGLVKKGARRWLNIGIIIQPSEMLKIATPLMLAWYYHKREQSLKAWDFLVGLILLLIPFALIVKQPDLGTALLVFMTGFYVIFLAGFPWKIILPIFIFCLIIVISIAFLQNTICAPEFSWQPLMHDYQKHRVCTLLDPNSDPLGKGFHILQSMIAIGSGGVIGKGWMNGTQAHLDFIPEKHTDFIFAVYSEEFGLIGNIVLIILYALLIMRCLYIASRSYIVFNRLIASSMGLIFFTYAFVNMGMVSGILPVVGVPLPFMSYGGTALATLGMALGILMSICRQNKGVFR